MLLAVCRLTSNSIITGLPVVHPVKISVFGRSIQKRSLGGGKTRVLEPRNDVLSTYFIRFSLARIFFVSRPCSSPPPPQETQKALRIEEAICAYRSDSITSLTIARSHFIRFCHCSNLSHLTLENRIIEMLTFHTNPLPIQGRSTQMSVSVSFRLRVVPHFSSRIVERAKRERA